MQRSNQNTQEVWQKQRQKVKTQKTEAEAEPTTKAADRSEEIDITEIMTEFKKNSEKSKIMSCQQGPFKNGRKTSWGMVHSRSKWLNPPEID